MFYSSFKVELFIISILYLNIFHFIFLTFEKNIIYFNILYFYMDPWKTKTFKVHKTTVIIVKFYFILICIFLASPY